MLWYVLQTKTGGEEKLVEMIHRMIPNNLYGECFFICHEQLWRRQQQTFVHVKRAFPGYVFITSREPEALFFCLKKIPAMTKMMADPDSFFLSVHPQEAAFLRQMTDEQHVIRLSYLETDGDGKILQVSGPLSSCVSKITRCRFGRRYVIVRLTLLGEEKEVLLGIILKEDICWEMKYGKIELPMDIPKKYNTVPDEAASGYCAENKRHLQKFSVGDFIWVSSGIFYGMPGMVYQVKDKTVKIGIRFLGRIVEMEIEMEILRKKEGNETK